MEIKFERGDSLIMFVYGGLKTTLKVERVVTASLVNTPPDVGLAAAAQEAAQLQAHSITQSVLLINGILIYRECMVAFRYRIQTLHALLDRTL